MKNISDKTYTGDCLATIHDIADTIRTTYCQPKDELTLQDLAKVYTAAEIMEALIDYTDQREEREEGVPVIAGVTDLARCQMCEAVDGLTYCKWCHEWFCMDGCIEDHVHQDGYQA